MKSVAVVLAVVAMGCASPAREPVVAQSCPIHSVFAHRRSVRALASGAEVIIPVAVGMTREWVEHGVRCELGDVRVRVRAEGDVYAVQITSDNPAVAKQIHARFEL